MSLIIKALNNHCLCLLHSPYITITAHLPTVNTWSKLLHKQDVCLYPVEHIQLRLLSFSLLCLIFCMHIPLIFHYVSFQIHCKALVKWEVPEEDGCKCRYTSLNGELQRIDHQTSQPIFNTTCLSVCKNLHNSSNKNTNFTNNKNNEI
jgi:hypothetical protein